MHAKSNNQSINHRDYVVQKKSRQFLSPPKFYFGKRPHTKKSTPGLFLAKQPQIKKNKLKDLLVPLFDTDLACSEPG